MKNEHTNWETLSTPALEKLLSADFLSDEDNLSPEEIHKITEVITKREREAHTLPQVDVDAAWETFLAKVKDLPPEEPPTIKEEDKVVPLHKPRRYVKKLRWAVATAAVLCALVVPASATGVLDDLSQWVSGTFSLSPRGDVAQGINDAMYGELKEEVAAITDVSVLPTWYPEDSILERITVTSDDFDTTLDAEFSLNGKPFYFTIIVVEDIDKLDTVYEKNTDPPERYIIDDIPHYIMSNYEQNLILWRNENVECCISGELPVEDLKAMVDSIYH